MALNDVKNTPIDSMMASALRLKIEASSEVRIPKLTKMIPTKPTKVAARAFQFTVFCPDGCVNTTFCFINNYKLVRL